MATRKTAIFTLTERITLAAGADPTSASTIDLASYVDVGDRQALQIHSVDFIYQGATASTRASESLPNNGTALIQVTDLNRGGLVFANDRALVSSGALHKSSQSGLFMEADMYPDNFGKGSDDGRFVVNDALYVNAVVDGTTSAAFNITVRVNASIVTLSQKDFMAIAIQSTAADN